MGDALGVPYEFQAADKIPAAAEIEPSPLPSFVRSHCLWARRLLEESKDPWQSAVRALRHEIAPRSPEEEELEFHIRPDGDAKPGGSGCVVSTACIQPTGRSRWEDRDRGGREFFPAGPSHTTGHAGPHPAVRSIEVIQRDGAASTKPLALAKL